MRSTLPEKADTVMVDRDVTFQTISDVCGISIEQLRALNPQYRRDVVNGSSEPSAISMPPAVVLSFIDNQQKIYAQSSNVTFSDNVDNSTYSETRSYRTPSTSNNYTTQSYSEPQQSYSSQQRNYSSSRNYSYSAGKKSYSRARSKVGKSHRKSSSAKGKNAYSKASKASKKRGNSGKKSSKRSSRRQQTTQNVTIKQGETLSGLARKHGTTVKKLQQINGIKGSNIRAGKQIRVK